MAGEQPSHQPQKSPEEHYKNAMETSEGYQARIKALKEEIDSARSENKRLDDEYESTLKEFDNLINPSEGKTEAANQAPQDEPSSKFPNTEKVIAELKKNKAEADLDKAYSEALKNNDFDEVERLEQQAQQARQAQEPERTEDNLATEGAQKRQEEAKAYDEAKGKRVLAIENKEKEIGELDTMDMHSKLTEALSQGDADMIIAIDRTMKKRGERRMYHLVDNLSEGELRQLISMSDNPGAPENEKMDIHKLAKRALENKGEVPENESRTNKTTRILNKEQIEKNREEAKADQEIQQETAQTQDVEEGKVESQDTETKQETAQTQDVEEGKVESQDTETTEEIKTEPTSSKAPPSKPRTIKQVEQKEEGPERISEKYGPQLKEALSKGDKNAINRIEKELDAYGNRQEVISAKFQAIHSLNETEVKQLIDMTKPSLSAKSLRRAAKKRFRILNKDIQKHKPEAQDNLVERVFPTVKALQEAIKNKDIDQITKIEASLNTHRGLRGNKIKPSTYGKEADESITAERGEMNRKAEAAKRARKVVDQLSNEELVWLANNAKNKNEGSLGYHAQRKLDTMRKAA